MIGIQTAVHLTAGVMRMPLRFYLPAAVVGSAAWAALYATIGSAVVQCGRKPRLGFAVLAAPSLAVATWVVRRRDELPTRSRVRPLHRLTAHPPGPLSRTTHGTSGARCART